MKLPASVAPTYDSYDAGRKSALLKLRDLVLETAVRTDGVGEIEECLKWGQPSFVTKKPKSGSTIRIDAIRNAPDKVAMYFICNTNLVTQFQQHYPDAFIFEGNRALIFDVGSKLPEDELRHCIAMALTYHLKG